MKLNIKFGIILISSHLFFMPLLLSESKNKFKLREIPNFNLDNLRKDIPVINDPFKLNDDFDYQLDPFENLSIKLIGLFKIDTDVNAMIRTFKGIGNYQVGDIIHEKVIIEQISINNKEIIITDGLRTQTYKLKK